MTRLAGWSHVLNGIEMASMPFCIHAARRLGVVARHGGG
jgi:hypothetical protein